MHQGGGGDHDRAEEIQGECIREGAVTMKGQRKYRESASGRGGDHDRAEEIQGECIGEGAVTRR